MVMLKTDEHLTPFIAHDIYVMEQFLKPERIKMIRDIWQEMLDYLESLLDRFMNDLPQDYRNRSLPEQPDIVWGERVIPNFRSTMEWLNESYIQRLNNDFDCYIGFSLGASTNGQREFSVDWMDEVEPEAAAKYQHLLFKAARLAEAIEHTIQQWSPGDLTHYFSQIGSHNSSFTYDPVIPPPLSYPVSRLNENIKVKADEKIPQTGFYLPNLPDSFPLFMWVSNNDVWELAGETRIPENDPEYPGSRILAPCTWTLIESVADTGNEHEHVTVFNVLAGQIATHSGYWFTIAKENSRQYFKQGEILPEIKSDWGEVYWQFDGEE
ncbi:hypothetical protein F909_04040 [Acinetobacter sp. ANC 3929]|uniref:hypothetical protein n=1 Tax=unclassified Acinetobacter TaxID=196816 RepID=UPI0002CFF64E|nr:MULTISPECIES: hypothetical protein [unclassified Acinetobacter]ENW78351.1 hypothetical protein F909_04040 [Acinetobacter sp. ANC 3929]MCH7353868.1 hypothetical protein [Acinetobacter sp. NIPH 2023]MCH7361203.1 hypothetical protein [Acinetobacter sp. NIPH 2024]